MRTVHAKLLIPIICAIVSGSLIIGVMGYRLAANIVISAFEEDGMRSVTYLRENIDMVISKAKLDLSALSVAPSVKYLLMGDEASEEHVEGYIMALVDQHTIYNSITILNTDGIIVASTSGSTGGDRSDREYFKDNMKGLSHISGVELSRQTGRLVTFISIPIRDTDTNAIIGAALTVIRLDELNTRYVVPVYLLGDHGYALIVSGSGEIIAHRNESMIFAPDNEDRAETDGIASEITINNLLSLTEGGGSLIFETSRDGVKFKAFAELSNYTDWYAVVICPVDDFYKEASELAWTTVILVSSVILFVTIITWIAVRGVTKSLSTTIRYADKVSTGNLETELSVKRTDEIGTLADSLREMVSRLKNKIVEAEESSKTIMESINYASKIQQNLLPDKSVFDAAFSDYSIIWEPRDIVGGDIYWAKNFEDGTVLCVSDCTGHGTPGALLTMLVVSAFESIIKETRHNDTAEILYLLDQRLASVMNVNTESNDSYGICDVNDGCDLAILFIKKDGSVSISAGNINVFVCNGTEVKRYKGQPVFIGEGKLKSKDEVNIHNIEANPDNKFYIASDGLTAQIGGDREKHFGYKALEQIILDNHNEPQSVISKKIWKAFTEYQSLQPRRDDVELITFKPMKPEI